MGGCGSFGAFMSQCLGEERNELELLRKRHSKLLRAIRKATRVRASSDAREHHTSGRAVVQAVLCSALREDKKLEKE